MLARHHSLPAGWFPPSHRVRSSRSRESPGLRRVWRGHRASEKCQSKLLLTALISAPHSNNYM